MRESDEQIDLKRQLSGSGTVQVDKGKEMIIQAGPIVVETPLNLLYEREALEQYILATTLWQFLQLYRI